MIGFRGRKADARCSEELRASAARTAAARDQLRSRWPEVLELVTFSEGRLIENHIGQSITESMYGIQKQVRGRHTA